MPKAPVSLSMSVRPSICRHASLQLPLDRFLCKCYSRKFSSKIRIWLKSGKYISHFTWGPQYVRGREGSVGIATKLRAGRSGDRIPVVAWFFAPVQTGPGAHPASRTMGTGSFPGVKRPGRGVDHPPPSSTEVEGRVELYICSPSGPSWSVLGRPLPLPLSDLITTYFYSRFTRFEPHAKIKYCILSHLPNKKHGWVQKMCRFTCPDCIGIYSRISSDRTQNRKHSGSDAVLAS